jgi:DNA-binding MarR family transcriptional regulator
MPDRDEAASLFGLAAIAAARFRRAAEARLRPTGLTWAQYGALEALYAASKTRGGLSQAELAHELETDSTTAMVLRGSLERKGLVERRDDPQDGRVKRLTLTGAGRRLLADAQPRVAAVLGGIEGLPGAELKRAAASLERLAAVAKAAEEAAAPPKPVSASPARRGRPRKEGGSAAAKRGARKTAGTASKAGAKKAAKAAKAPKTAKGAKGAQATKPKAAKSAKPKTLKAAKAAKAPKTARKAAPKAGKAASKAAPKARRAVRAKAPAQAPAQSPVPANPAPES